MTLLFPTKISSFFILPTIEVGFSTWFPRVFQILYKHVNKYCQNNADRTKNNWWNVKIDCVGVIFIS